MNLLIDSSSGLGYVWEVQAAGVGNPERALDDAAVAVVQLGVVRLARAIVLDPAEDGGLQAGRDHRAFQSIRIQAVDQGADPLLAGRGWCPPGRGPRIWSRDDQPGVAPSVRSHDEPEDAVTGGRAPAGAGPGLSLPSDRATAALWSHPHQGRFWRMSG